MHSKMHKYRQLALNVHCLTCFTEANESATRNERFFYEYKPNVLQFVRLLYTAILRKCKIDCSGI